MLSLLHIEEGQRESKSMKWKRLKKTLSFNTEVSDQSERHSTRVLTWSGLMFYG
jgi:hypothetical protein